MSIPANCLPKKEKDAFRSVVDCYEKKTYTKGVKQADMILKKFPNHGETQAMKGLLYNCMDRKEEALELVKSGLKNDVKSHVCWHVFGLIHKAENNYKEAIKCYLNALRIDVDNQNILRDLSWLYVQMRDMPAFLETRRKVLTSRPSIKASWVAFAVANYFAGNYDDAYKAVESFNNEVEDKAEDERYEASELLLFQNKCLEKQSKFEEALQHLKTHATSIVDKLSLHVKTAELLVLTRKFEEARIQWLILVKDQPDNYRFHCGLQVAILEALSPAEAQEMFNLKRWELPSTMRDLDTDTKNHILDFYVTNSIESRATTKIKMTLSTGDMFADMIKNHMKKCIHSSVPALCHDICALVRQPNCVTGCKEYVTDTVNFAAHSTTQLVVNMLNDFLSNLKAHNSFDSFVSEETPKEPPSSYLWALFLLCHMTEMSGRLEEALVMIDECIAHTPTALDMHIKKARLLKKLGDLHGAAEVMDNCRALDLQDRYLNNMATKYLLRADHMAQAMTTVAMFTKHEGDPQQTLCDLQCNWYELEAAESYMRSHEWGMALKKLYSVQKHFVDYFDDQFDFHGFCIRKTTLRAYSDILVMQDNLFSHKFFQRSARNAFEVFLHLTDSPEDVDGLGHLSAADRKKERARIKKRKEKEAKVAELKEKEAAVEAKWTGEAADNQTNPKTDSDPLGEKLLLKTFMTEALQWAGQLGKIVTTCEPDTLALMCEVLMRKSRAILATRCLVCGLTKHSDDPRLTVMLIKMSLRARSGTSGAIPMKTEVRQAVEGELRGLLHEQDPATFVQGFADRAVASRSLPHLIAAARCHLLLDKTNTAAVVALFADMECVWQGRGVTVFAMHELLELAKASLPAEVLEEWTASAKLHFPRDTKFQAPRAVDATATPAAGESESVTSSSSSSCAPDTSAPKPAATIVDCDNDI